MTETYFFLLGLLLLHSGPVTGSLEDNEVPIVTEPVLAEETTKELTPEESGDEAKVEVAAPADTGNSPIEDPAEVVDPAKDEEGSVSSVDPAKAVEPANIPINTDTEVDPDTKVDNVTLETEVDPVAVVSSNKTAASNETSDIESSGTDLNGNPDEAATSTDPTVADPKLLPEDKPEGAIEPQDTIPQNPKFHTNETAPDPIPSKNDSEDDVTPTVSPEKEVGTSDVGFPPSDDFRLSFAPKRVLPGQTGVSFLQLFLLFAVLSVFAYVGYSYRHRLKLFFFNSGNDIHYHPLRTMQHNAVD